MAKKVQDIASPAIISNMIFMADMARSTANRQDCSMYLNYAVRLMKQMMEEKNMKYQHIIFDLDGTLIDTEQAVLKTWQHTLKDFHYFFPLEELRIILGIPTENALKKLNVTVGPDFQDRWMENYTIYAGKAAFFPGVEHMLDVLRQRGHSLGHGDHVLGGYPGFPQHLRDGAAQHLQIVLRILDGPVVGQRRAVGKLPRHHAVRISKDRRGQLLSCVEIDEDGPPRERSVVHADSITTHIQQPPCFSFMIADSRQKNKAQRRKRCAGKREQKVRQRAGERGEAHGAERRPPRPPERL